MLIRTYLPAQIVQNLIEMKIQDEGDFGHRLENNDIYSSPWINGREKGFSFYLSAVSSATVFVAEDRGSDCLTITTSVHMDWKFVTEEEYSKREFFSYGDYEKVSNRVLEILCNGYEKNKIAE
jgi:hypothetical protein